MKRIPKKILAFLTAVVAAVFLLQIDDDLSAEANAMLDSVKWESPSDAYLYLLGIRADLETNPIDEGEKLLSRIRRSESAYIQAHTEDGQLFEYEVGNYKPSLVLPDNDIFCPINELSCTHKLFSSSKLDLDNNAFKTLKKRYLKFLHMKGLHTLAMPHLFDYLPDYGYLIRANKLVILDAIYKARSCCPREAADNLYDLIELLKRQIEQSDNLIGKTVNYSLLNETIEVLSMLLREFNLKGKEIELLSKEQLSLNLPISREFASLRTTIANQVNGNKFEWIPQWAERIVFKQNITINAALPLYAHAVHVSKSSQTEIVDLMDSLRDITLEKSWVRNNYGTHNYLSSLPNFGSFITSGFDLNAKISLFNDILGVKITPEIVNSIPNPYYNDSSHNATINVETNQACFNGPLENRKNFRCISLANP